MTRTELEAQWLTLTRVKLPNLAASRDWPVQNDHCFQRILLDAACNGRWYDSISKRPAYRHASAEILQKAIELGEHAVDGRADLRVLNRQSLSYRK